VWSWAFRGSLEIQSVFVFAGVISGPTHLIYGYHLYRWLMLGCAGTLSPNTMAFCLSNTTSFARLGDVELGMMATSSARVRVYSCRYIV
jgi:hypothetical protein